MWIRHSHGQHLRPPGEDLEKVDGAKEADGSGFAALFCRPLRLAGPEMLHDAIEHKT